jgi:hypothetical protein
MTRTCRGESQNGLEERHQHVFNNSGILYAPFTSEVFGDDGHESFKTAEDCAMDYDRSSGSFIS